MFGLTGLPVTGPSNGLVGAMPMSAGDVAQLYRPGDLYRSDQLYRPGQLYPPSPSLRAYHPTWRDHVALGLLDAGLPETTVDGLIGSRGLGPSGRGTGMGLVDLTPLGLPFTAQEAGQAFQRGDLLGGSLLAAGMLPIPGAKAASKLPMDKASRMARAREMGFRTDMPLYHGTNQSFSGFDLAKAGDMTGAATARQGVWVALEPEVAEEFAQRATRKSQGNAQIYPLRHRAKNPGEIVLTGDEMIHQIAATLAEAFDSGHDAVMIRNYTALAGPGKSILVVRDPAQLRSPAAAFDPAKRHSNDLLAGLAAFGFVPAATAALTREADGRGESD